MPQGMLEWVKENPENEAKLAKAFGIQLGLILASFSEDPNDLEAFFRDVILRTHNYGIFRRFGKGIYRTHTELRKKMDANYFRGVEEGRKQVTTGENLYLKHLQTY